VGHLFHGWVTKITNFKNIKNTKKHQKTVKNRKNSKNIKFGVKKGGKIPEKSDFLKITPIKSG